MEQRETAQQRERELLRKISEIRPVDGTLLRQARDRLDSLAKPPGSLGRLEEIAARVSAVTGTLHNDLSGKGCVVVMAADNGVCREGVASAPQSVTAAQTVNMLRGLTGVAVLARHFESGLMVVDVGVDAELAHPDLIRRKIRRGTGSFRRGPAMERDEAVRAVLTGMEMAEKAWEQGFRLLGVGEMGIGNTTTASAVLAALLGLRGEEAKALVGKGGGLTEEAYELKKKVVLEGLEKNRPDEKDPLDVLSGVGGLDLAAMTGAFLGGARQRIPVVIDGFISAAAALCAVRMNPLTREYLFASHHSPERGFAFAMKELGMRADLHLDMRLGEGSGCPLMFAVMESACSVMRQMATFEEAEIDDRYLERIRKPEAFDRLSGEMEPAERAERAERAAAGEPDD